MARTEIGDVARIDDEPVARVGSRFLPVPAALLPPLPDAPPGAVDVPVPAGTPVHATEAGRVTHAEGSAVGEVIVRGDDGTRFHYRRLLPSTVTVAEGQSVDAGSVLGLVATSPTGAALEFGIQSSDGTWHDAAERLVGLADPAELFLLPPVAGDPALVAELPSQRRPARAAASTVESAPASEPPPATTAEPTESASEPQTAQPAASAADRLTRRRPRAGGTTSAEPPAPAPPDPGPPRPTTDDTLTPAAEPDAASAAPSEPHTVPAPVPEPDTDPDSDAEDASADEASADEATEDGATEDGATDEDRASALLVSRRRRPRGKR